MCGLYEDQIQNFSRSLEEENNLRKKRELEIKELNLQISSLQSELTTLTTNLATSTESSTSQRDETLQKISVLQSNVKEMEEHNLCLQNELVTVTTKLQSVREDLHSRRQELDKQNAHLKRDLMNKLAALEEIRPRCASLEDEYQHKTAMYDAEKEEIIRMKNHRNGLTDAAKQLQKQIKSIVDTQERLRMEVIRERAYAREQLRHQTLCVQKTEEQVAIANRKLEAVVTENLRISEMIETLQQDCLWMTRTCNVVKTHDTTVEGVFICCTFYVA
jgi:chromosome segregation ATPase